MKARSLLAAATTFGFGVVGCTMNDKPGEEEETSEEAQAVTMQTANAAASIHTNGFQSLGDPLHLVGAIATLPPTTFDITLSPSLKWEAVETTELTWDGDKVRQGQTLDVERKGSTSARFMPQISSFDSETTVPNGQLRITTSPSASAGS